MNKKDIELLINNGWTVECELPFEIRHNEMETFATNYAAQLILDSLKSELNKDKEIIEDLAIKFTKNEGEIKNSDNYLTPLNFGCLGTKTSLEIITKFYYFFKNEGII